MKKLMIVMLALGLTVTASAQGKVSSRGHHPRTKVVVVAPSYPRYGSGLGYRYSPFYNPYYSAFNSPFYDPFYQPRVIEQIPSQLQLSLDDIDNDYDYKISSARHDKSLSGSERRQKIRDLRHEKEDAIIDAKRQYFNGERK